MSKTLSEDKCFRRGADCYQPAVPHTFWSLSALLTGCADRPHIGHPCSAIQFSESLLRSPEGLPRVGTGDLRRPAPKVKKKRPSFFAGCLSAWRGLRKSLNPHERPGRRRHLAACSGLTRPPLWRPLWGELRARRSLSEALESRTPEPAIVEIVGARCKAFLRRVLSFLAPATRPLSPEEG